MITRRSFSSLASAAALGAMALPARAQAWPSRYVRLVVPFAPAGGVDVVGRLLAHRLSEYWDQQVVVETKPGAGGNIAAEMVARSEPDGYTLFIVSIGQAINRFIYPTLTYDPVADFAPVTLICVYPNVMVVPPNSPARSVQEFIAHAKANPGKITFASSGTGTSVHLSGELFKRMAGIEMTHVPYRGAGPAMSDLLPGRVDVMFATSSSALPQIRADKLRGLAVTTLKRLPVAPELPTIAEAGLAGFDVSSWFSIFAPARTPPEIVAKVHGDTVRALREPAIAGKLEQLGAAVTASTPAELAAHLKAETDKWGPVIKAAGIRAGGN
jgi:tripartite-type tricarboxylate transporter receptor subunit TctC